MIQDTTPTILEEVRLISNLLTPFFLFIVRDMTLHRIEPINKNVKIKYEVLKDGDGEDEALYSPAIDAIIESTA